MRHLVDYPAGGAQRGLSMTLRSPTTNVRPVLACRLFASALSRRMNLAKSRAGLRPICCQALRKCGQLVHSARASRSELPLNCAWGQNEEPWAGRRPQLEAETLDQFFGTVPL